MRNITTIIASTFAIGATALLAAARRCLRRSPATTLRQITPQQAASRQGPNGQRVRWGGEIIKVEPRPNTTCFEILSRELYADARPNRRDHSEGRFIACKQGFYDPAVYGKGRDVTVVGAISGNEKHKVGRVRLYICKSRCRPGLHVAASAWPHYRAGYYDPLWGPYLGPY